MTTDTDPGAAYAALPDESYGPIMGAAYDFRDAHISGSVNLKRSAHAALETAVRNAISASHGQPYPTIDDLCARIKAADDAAADRDYMLDSNDCIAVLRGQWKGPMAMDKPERASHGQAPAGESLRTDALCDLSYSHGLKAGWNYCASDDLAGFERAQKIGAEALRTLKSTTAQAAPAYKDSTPELHIGDSAFESWYSTYSPAHKSDKQRARDAYAAGMGDPLVMAAPAAVAGCTRSHPHEIMDAACRAKAAIAEMQNMAARGAEATAQDLERFVSMLAAAPTTQAAPQQEAQEPAAVVVPCHTPPGKRVALYSAKQDLPIGTQLYTAPQPSPQQGTSPTAGMSIAQRILHVGGRNNAAGYVEFGSTQAVEALVKHVLRDLQPSPAAQGDALDAACQRACMELPEGMSMAIHLERDAGWIELHGSYGDQIELPNADGSLAEQVHQAIDAARAAQEGK